MNKIKSLIMLATLLIASLWVKAEGEIVITGSLPELTSSSCSFNADDFVLSPSGAEAYIAGAGVTVTSDCSGGLVYFCHISDIEETDCSYTAIRHFSISNDCDWAVDLEQTITVNKRPSITGTLSQLSWTSCTFDPDSLELGAEEALAYLQDSAGLVFEEGCSEDLNVWCFVFDVQETECVFTARRDFLINNNCDTEGITISQSIVVNKNYEQNEYTLDPLTIDASSLEEGAFPSQDDHDAIIDYIDNMGFQVPSCWNYYFAYYDNPVDVTEPGSCEKKYEVTFHLSHGDDIFYLCTQKIILHQTVTLSPDVVEQEGSSLTDLTVIGTCDDATDIAPLDKIQDFADYGVTFSNYLYPERFEISYYDERVETDNCKSSKVLRTYTIDYDCVTPPFHAELQQIVSTTVSLAVYGVLEPQYLDVGEEPETYSSLNELKKKGMRLSFSCVESELEMLEPRDESGYLGFPDLTLRWYVLRSIYCDALKDSVSQVIQSVNKNPTYFHLDSYTDVTDENTKDGTATLSQPGYYQCEECAGCPMNQLFFVRWTNKTLNKLYETDPNDEHCDIFYIDSLSAGLYKVEVFPICADEGVNTSKPIFSDDFEIKVATTDLFITYGVRLYSNHSYLSAFGLHMYKPDNISLLDPDLYDEEHPFDYFAPPPGAAPYEGDHFLQSVTGATFHHGLTIDLNSLKHQYKWEVERGTTEFDRTGMHSSGGSDAGMTFEEWVQMYEPRYGQHFVVAQGTNGMPRAMTFKMYDLSGDKLLKSKRKPFYHEELKCSNDPNEIFGPTGYTDADSIVVRMINATDDINYTIQFENDPEFATAAAARVKITCPLDEHADPTTFRLGNFGFGEYTFDVPPLSSYYNNRINMDSLGYWLDVTASVQVPENEAYWIFQTIDPATGVAPIDSLGFLPVNDTLFGNGEGFVTFTVSPKPGNNRSQISTGDSIVEQAQIYFDENEVVPTNRYKNMFDAVAPASYIVCDTTGAFESRVLNIGFNATDDEGGSGVQYIELYASIDRGNFELVGAIEKDSIFAYPMTRGSHFEFMGLAVDNVNNKEPNKPYAELTYSFGNPPTDLKLDNRTFNENDLIATRVGNFTTIDDQSSDDFVYTLVEGQGSEDNSLFSIVGNELRTNFDFRCYGSYNFNIRVRTTDVTSEYLEKPFVISAYQTEHAQSKFLDENLCPGQSLYFGGQYLTSEGVYWDTLSTVHGCDSIVCLRITLKEEPVTTMVDDELCFGYDYTGNGFDLSADSLASILTSNWSMNGDTILFLDNYVENRYGCYDTTRLTLTVHPSYEVVLDEHVCQSDLPYVFMGMPFSQDTVVIRDLHTATGCDSTLVLNLTINPYSTQSDNLANGWNWYSTYIDQSNGRGLANLEAALGTHGRTIKSQTKFVQYYPDYNAWYGSLTEIDNKSMYMIQADGNFSADVFGCYAGDDTIALHPGWTWIGYPMPTQMYVSQTPIAVSGYPTDGDIFKSNAAFAMYYADYGLWYGTLSLLNPGQGYMYKLNGNNDKYLYYPNASRAEGHIVEVPEAHWVDNVHKFADNITILGLIELDGQAIESDSLEVGVFCNNEERGSGRAIYLEGLDAYRIFLTVHGENGDELSFRLFDHNRDKERRIRCRQQLTFHADDHYGDLRNPYVIRFATDYDKLIEAEICEGQYYTENGFRAFRQGTYFKELTGQHGNDSIVRLDLTVNPVYQYEEEVVAVEFPFPYGDLTFDRPGTYNLPFVTEHGCDSLLVLKVVPYEGARELLISPVPANRSDRVTLYFPFTRAEQQGLQVEVYTLAGSLMQYDTPTRFPIELKPFEVAGTYMVKVTMGTGEVVTGKIIIK